MRVRSLFSLAFISIVVPCCSSNTPLKRRLNNLFSTTIDVTLFEGKEEYLNDIENIFTYYDKICDNYLPKSENNIYKINKTNEDIEIDEELYKVLKASFNITEAKYFNPLCGSLVKKWKDSLAQEKVLDEQVIEDELNKIENSSLLFKDNSVIQRLGEAEIDLGGIAKGYTLDIVLEYLTSKEIKSYLINAGRSSLLLGVKQSDTGLFSVGLDEFINNAYIEAKNCFISTSGLTRQGLEINGTKYSHIVNPQTGSAINLYDGVIVLSNEGYIGDAFSTSFMLTPLEEIKEIEQALNIKTIVIKESKILYSHKDIEVKFH